MVNKRGAVILGGLFLFVLAVGLFFIFQGEFVESAPQFCSTSEECSSCVDSSTIRVCDCDLDGDFGLCSTDCMDISCFSYAHWLETPVCVQTDEGASCQEHSGGSSCPQIDCSLESVQKRCYFDYDGDGYGPGYPNLNEPAFCYDSLSCDCPLHTGPLNTQNCLENGVCPSDCDDYNPNVYPGAQEICNGIDDNCNGLIDEGNLCPEGYICAGSEGCVLEEGAGGDTTPPTISISYPSNNQDIVNPWNHFEAKVTDNVDSTINCNYNIKRSDGSLVSGGFNENPISFTNNTLKYVGSGWNSDIDFVVSGLTFNLTCTDSAGNTASALRTGINVIEDKYANCASCTSDSQCESGHCAPLTPFGSNGLCVPVNTCSNYTGTSSCYVSSGATKCSDTDLYTCNPYSWTLTESNSLTCGAGSPTLKWKDPSTGHEISYAEITPEGIFPTVTLVLEDYSGDSVNFDIKERYNSNNYAIKTGVTQTGNYYYTWSLSQADLDKSPQTDGVNYTYYGYVSIGGQNYQTSSLKITDKRAVAGESTYCGDGIKQTPNDAGFNEQCDDGDNNGVIPSGIPCGTYVTYCGNTCTNQTVYGGDCPTGEPICGNGIVEDGEQCDDGNTNNGDGCSSTCQWEKDLYWTTTTNSKIGSKLTINASDLIGKRYRMWIEHSASDTTFDLWEYDALNSDDLLRTNLPGTLTTGNKRYYTWTLSNMDFTKTEKESTYKFYFIIDGENSRNYLPYGQLEIEVINGDAPRCDDGIQNGDETGIDCGGSCDACLETGPQFCSDYITKTTCENFDQEVADRSATPPAICEWTSETQTEGNYCIGTTLVSVNGIEIGRCQKTELLPRTQSCETSDFLNISWNENFVWGDSNDYSTRINCETANNVTTGCMESSGRWHYDPNSDSIKCSGTKSNVVPCPAQVRLSFFSWKNLVIAIIIIGLIYLSILEFRKNRSKVKKIEKEEKEQRQKDYKKSKRKVAKKKTVSKKKTVGKK